MANTRAYVAEFLGTFTLCFAGIGAVMSSTPSIGGATGLTGIALASGLALAVAVAAFAGISGAHFNPAITIGMAAVRRIGPAAAGVYIAVQLLAAFIATLVCRALFPPDAVAQSLSGLALPGPWVSSGALFLGEAIGAFLLTITLFATTIDERGRAIKIGGLGVGLTLAALILAIGPVTGPAFNPARAFAPALLSGLWNFQIWYWIGPIVGALAAAFVYDQILNP